MRKALVIGINYYPESNSLFGCVNDANRVAELLSRHGNGNKNFDVNLITAEIDKKLISQKEMKYELTNLFATTCEVALFYFAGHGYADEHGGYILSSECVLGDEGINLSYISNLIQHSHASNNVVILDCCQSGAMGKNVIFGDNSLIPSGTTFLLACKENQYSEENNGNGVFTDLIVDALSGGASNLVGKISPGSIYSYVDIALGLWQQRPVFKTNVETFISLRDVRPPIKIEDLRKINQFFPNINYEYPLNPSYEPRERDSIKENAEIFRILQRYNRLNLLVPVNCEHMYDAAIESKTCKLTPLGVHYWNLVENKRI